MSKKKTHDEYVKEVSIKNPNVDIIGTYINSNTKIAHKCVVCGHTWESFPFNILKGSGCPKCANNKKANNRAFTINEYTERLAQINPRIEFIGDYKNANTRALHLCKVCGYEWMAYPSNVLSGKGCKRCFDKISADIRRKTHEVYVAQVNSINTNIAVLGEYVNARIPIKHKCRICGHEWNVSPDSILQGHGCPKCIESRGESVIEEYLIEHQIQFKPQHTFLDCRNKKPLPFDFYIPNMNVCIEYDGIQHFEPVEYFGGVDALKRTQHNDTIKTRYCLSNNIDLLRIKYDQDVNNKLDQFFNNTKLIKEAI